MVNLLVADNFRDNFRDKFGNNYVEDLSGSCEAVIKIYYLSSMLVFKGSCFLQNLIFMFLFYRLKNKSVSTASDINLMQKLP